MHCWMQRCVILPYHNMTRLYEAIMMKPSRNIFCITNLVMRKQEICMLTHGPLRYVELILQVHFSNSSYELISWALPVKIVLRG